MAHEPNRIDMNETTVFINQIAADAFIGTIIGLVAAVIIILIWERSAK